MNRSSRWNSGGDLWTINLHSALGIVYLVDVALGVVLGDIFVELEKDPRMPAKCSATCEQSLREQFKGNFIGCFIISGNGTEMRTEVFAKHSVLQLHASTPLDSNLLPPGCLSTLIVCRLKGTYEEEQLRRQLKSPSMLQLVEQLRKNTGASLDNVLIKDVEQKQRGRDSISWQPSLSADAYISISCYDIDRYDSELSLSIFTGNPTLEADLRAYAERRANEVVETPYTLGQFASSLRYQKAEQMAKRNAAAVASQVAHVLGVKIELTEDLCAVRPLPGQNADKQPSALVSSSGRPLVAVPTGITLFNNLFSNEFQTAEGPTYKCVAIYCDAANPSCGSGSPAFPISPLDGIAMVHNLSALNHVLPPHYTILDLDQTLPCGAPFTSGTPNLSTSETRYVSLCLSSKIGAKVDPAHPKINRVYVNSQQFLRPIAEQFAIPEVEVRTLRHAASTV